MNDESDTARIQRISKSMLPENRWVTSTTDPNDHAYVIAPVSDEDTQWLIECAYRYVDLCR